MSERMTYRIDRDLKLVLLRLEGEALPVDVASQLVDRILADPAHQTGMNWLFDRSEVPDIPPPDYARSIAAMLSERRGHLGSCRLALLMRPGLVFEKPLEHLAHLAAAGIEAQVFTSWTQAIAWVGARTS